MLTLKTPAEPLNGGHKKPFKAKEVHFCPVAYKKR